MIEEERETQSEPAWEPPREKRPGEARRAEPTGKRRNGGVLFWIFAVIIPVGAVGMELIGRPMASVYFDPLPTIWHLLAVSAVPAALVLGEVVLHFEKSISRRLKALALIGNGFAVSISLMYSIVYLPTFPLSAIAILAMGAGLLGLSPLFTLIGSLSQARRLLTNREHLGFKKTAARLHPLGGAVGAILLLSALHLSSLVTEHGIGLAISSSPQERARGIWLVKTFGGEDEVLRRCYSPLSGQRPFLFEDWEPAYSADSDEYRRLYFRLTGKPFNSVPPPGEASGGLLAIRGAHRQDLRDEWEQELAADSEIGGSSVAGRVKGLSLRASSIDASLASAGAADAGPCIGYIEWTLTFRNDSDSQREARAQIALPDGANASRLTLWINGEEREAAFGRRGQVRAAYRDVAVVRRRDPALLTTMGPNRLLLQCFPIEPRSNMKVKLGVTTPLLVRDGRAWLRLPHFSERNFTVAPNFSHNVWIESKAPLLSTSPQLIASTPDARLHRARGRLLERELQDPAVSSIAMDFALLENTRCWKSSLPKISARMTIKPAPAPASTGSLFLVVDGSECMNAADLDWKRIVDALPAQASVNATVAGHVLETWRRAPEKLDVRSRSELVEWLGALDFDGGCDPLSALESAWDACARSGGGVILWLHGPLPVELSPASGLEQRMRRQPPSKNGPQLISVPLLPGPNRVVESLAGPGEVQQVTVIASPSKTAEFAARWLASEEIARTYALAVDGQKLPAAHQAATPAGNHLVRLAVGEEVACALLSADPKRLEQATRLAVRTRIVTPLSGAVVLENMEQYKRHGLDPDAELASGDQKIPGVPEPEEWALIFLALAGMGALILRKRRAAACAR